MKHYTIYEITEMLKEWKWSGDIFNIPGDLHGINTVELDAITAAQTLNMIHEKWLELEKETTFFVISEGTVKIENEWKYRIEIGMTNPAIEEFNLNRNIVI